MQVFGNVFLKKEFLRVKGQESGIRGQLSVVKYCWGSGQESGILITKEKKLQFRVTFSKVNRH